MRGGEGAQPSGHLGVESHGGRRSARHNYSVVDRCRCVIQPGIARDPAIKGRRVDAQGPAFRVTYPRWIGDSLTRQIGTVLLVILSFCAAQGGLCSTPPAPIRIMAGPAQRETSYTDICRGNSIIIELLRLYSEKSVDLDLPMIEEGVEPVDA